MNSSDTRYVQEVHVAPLALHHLDQGIGDEPRGHPVRDRVRERHQGDRQERGDADRGVSPVDVADALHHEVAHDDQRRGGRLRWHDPRDRREEHRQQEQHADHHRGHARAAAVADARARLDVGGVRRRRDGAAGRGRETVDQQHVADPGQLAFLVQQPGLLPEADGRAHRVEEVRQHDGQDRGDRGPEAEDTEHLEVEVADEVEVGGRHDVRGDLGDPVRPHELVAPDDVDDHRDQRAEGDADQDRATHVLRATNAAVRASAMKNTRIRSVVRSGAIVTGVPGADDDDATVHEADDRQEHPDADPDRELQVHRDRVHDHLAQSPSGPGPR